MKKLTFITGALALMLAFGNVEMAQAQDTAPEASFVDENGDGIDDNARKRHRRGHRGFLRGVGADLSDEQKTELKALVDGLKEGEATKEDVRAAVEAKLTEWGIELPERPTIASRLGDALTEAQAADLTALVDGLKEAEASHADVRAAVDAQLETWGIEKPEKPEKVSRRGHGRRGGRR